MVNTAFHPKDWIAVVQGTETGILLAELPPPLRVAVAYAPARTQEAWAALLVFDHRLSRALVGASEPLLAQIKLSWWRDRMRTPASAWPAGEPLLASLSSFDGERPALETLVDAWEGLIGEETGPVQLERLASARAGAIAALARVSGSSVERAAIEAHARRWTIPDEVPPAPAGLPRGLRPLAILAAVATERQPGPMTLLRIVRLGLFGR